MVFHIQHNCTSAGWSHKCTALLYYWSSSNSIARHLTSISWHGSCPAGLKTDTKSTGFVLKGCLGALHNRGVSYTPGGVRAGRRLPRTLSLADINISKGLEMSSCCFQNALTETSLLGEGSRICVNQRSDSVSHHCVTQDAFILIMSYSIILWASSPYIMLHLVTFPVLWYTFIRFIYFLLRCYYILH